MMKHSALKQDLYLIRQIFKNLRFFLIPTQKMRSRYIRKHDVFKMFGDNVVYQPRKLPSDPKCVKLHNNIKISADVNFITHDMIYDVINHLEDNAEYCKENLGCIEVMDNVMIGLGSLILPGVKIGPNAIVGAGSVVTKDIPEGSVAVGVPAKVIGKFSDVVRKQKEMSGKITGNSRFEKERIRQAWELFDESHKE